MRLLIVGSLDGHITAAGKIALSRGAKVAHVDDVDQALHALRNGQGADLIMFDVALEIQRMIDCLRTERIGPAMSIALLTTLYGALMANVVFLPLATKLERNATVEQLVSQIYTMGVASMGRQENPRRLEMLLNTVLPAGQQIRYFD